MSTFAEGGTVKRASRPRSTRAAVVYAHTIADELLALWQETLRTHAINALDVDHPAVHMSVIDDSLFRIVDTLRDLRHQVEQ